MHTLLDLRGNLPVYIHLTDTSVHDVKALDSLCVEMGAIYLLAKVMLTSSDSSTTSTRTEPFS